MKSKLRRSKRSTLTLVDYDSISYFHSCLEARQRYFRWLLKDSTINLQP